MCKRCSHVLTGAGSLASHMPSTTCACSPNGSFSLALYSLALPRSHVSCITPPCHAARLPAHALWLVIMLLIHIWGLLDRMQIHIPVTL